MPQILVQVRDANALSVFPFLVRLVLRALVLHISTNHAHSLQLFRRILVRQIVHPSLLQVALIV